MKRIGYLFDRICDTENLKLAFKMASQGKKNKKYVRPYIENQDYYIALLQKWLREGTLKLGGNKHKIIYEHTVKKTREIVVPKFFPDQVVHWAYCNALKPVFMKGMYKWSCGSIKNRGIHYGINKVQKVLKSPKAKYILKTDFRKYFQSVNKDKLIELLGRKIKDKKVMELTKLILGDENGLPIGYYTSQWFANFYLESIDHYIKEIRGTPFYFRMIDDMVLMDSNKKRLHQTKVLLDAKLEKEMYKISFKPNWQLWLKDSRPLDFLGFRIRGNQKRMRKDNFYRLSRTVRKCQKRGYCTVHSARSILSRLGWLFRSSNGINFYVKVIKPIISKGEACTIVSLYDKKLGAIL